LKVSAKLDNKKNMKPETLKHIPSICRDWLQQSPVTGEVSLTILPGGPLLETVEVELQSLMTPDGTTISSAVDIKTGARYASVLRKPGMSDVVINTPLEKIKASLDQRLLPPGDPPPPGWRIGQYRGARETQADPVNEAFPLISIGDRVFVMDGWDLEERGYGVVKDILPTTYPYPTYLVEIDGKISWETRYDLFLVTDK
jgi:hypothetical protein